VPAAYPTPADDVLALGHVVRFALSGGDPSAEAPGPLTTVTAACTAQDAAARPLPAQIATLARAAAPPEPIVLPASDLRQEVSGHARRHGAGAQGTRLAVLGIALALTVTIASVFIAAHRGVSPRQVGQGRPAASASTLADPRALVAELASARARAFTAASEPALAAVDAPGSAAVASDAAFLARLHGAGVRLRGLAFAVSDARMLEVDAGHAVVQAEVSTSAHVEVGSDGGVVRRVPASPVRDVRLALVATSDGWRITSDG
jgi:hypothetical protein